MVVQSELRQIWSNKKRTLRHSLICPVPFEWNEENQNKTLFRDPSFSFYHSINAERLINKIYCDLRKRYLVSNNNAIWFRWTHVYVREKKKILHVFTKFYSDSWCANLYMHRLYKCFRRYIAIKYFMLGKGCKNLEHHLIQFKWREEKKA